jgi:hypothetical protein
MGAKTINGPGQKRKDTGNNMRKSNEGNKGSSILNCKKMVASPRNDSKSKNSTSSRSSCLHTHDNIETDSQLDIEIKNSEYETP